jgi:hypothetical protein
MDENKVAVLIEQLMSQFRPFGESLEGFREETNQRFDTLEQKLDNHIDENRHEFIENRQEHQQLMQMIKELDREVQVEIKCVK